VTRDRSASRALAFWTCIRGEREHLLARVYPRMSADMGLTYAYDAIAVAPVPLLLAAC
jgi:hypothetical protein